VEISKDKLFEQALELTLKKFKFHSLKVEQETCIRKLVVDHEDVFAVLPTGYGKSLIYQVLPSVFTEMDVLEYGHCNDAHIVIVVSPLEYIRVQQVENLNRLGIWAVSLGPSFNPTENVEAVSARIIYGSAEQWLSDTWIKKLKDGELGIVKTLVIDEVHTVEMW
jgi:ATP-dependent DNA helicase RecQ